MNRVYIESPFGKLSVFIFVYSNFSTFTPISIQKQDLIDKRKILTSTWTQYLTARSRLDACLNIRPSILLCNLEKSTMIVGGRGVAFTIWCVMPSVVGMEIRCSVRFATSSHQHVYDEYLP